MLTSESQVRSITNNIWIIKSQYPDNIVGEILKLRDMSEQDLEADYDELDRFAPLRNLRKIAKRILDFKDKKICIFADYDVDGLCGGAILQRALQMLSIQSKCYIPRREEGYGLSKNAVKKMHEEGIDLTITVDCGIKNEEEVSYAKSLGMEVIVTDHHKIIGSVPDCPILHSDLTRSTKSSFLSGGGVAFMLARELINSEKSKWLLDLAAMSTFADMVPLVGANRIICKYGLIVLNQTRNIGLQELAKVSNIEQGNILPYHLSFILGPKINASGRLEDPALSFELLTTQSNDTAQRDAKLLDELNKKRQDIVQAHLDVLIEKYKNLKVGREAIIEFDPEFKDGVLGLVAGKLTEKFYRPSIALTSHDGILKGSARSISGIDITDILSSLQEYLIAFGGHSMAAGLSLKECKLKDFTKQLNKRISVFNDEIFVKKLDIDALLRFDQLSLDLLDDLDRLEPFGIANPKPVFAISDMVVSSERECGAKRNHQQIKLSSVGGELEGIIFNTPENGKFQLGKKYDVAFNLQKDTFRGASKVKVLVKDFKEK